MNRARTITTLLGLIFAGFAFAATISPVFAQTEGRDPANGFVQCSSTFPGSTSSTLPPCDLCAGFKLLNNATFYAVSFVLGVATVFVLVSGFLYVTSAGDEHRITQAKTTLKFAIVGFIIAMTAGIIVKTIVLNVFKSSTPGLGTFVCDIKTAPSLPGTPGGGTGGTTTPPPGGTTSGVWGNPDDPNYYSENITTVTGKCGPDFSANKMAAANFKAFIDALCDAGYTPKSIGGYNNRDIGGTNSKSNHAYGAAIDIDPNLNPRYGTGAGGPYALPPSVGQIANQYGLFWGGNYCSSKDYMHFEVIGAPATPTRSCS